jgi:hypothetical protein
MEFWAPAPVKVAGLDEAVTVPLDLDVAVAAGATDTIVPATTVVAVSTTRAADAVLNPVIVSKTTFGTTIDVEMTVVMLDEGMTEPAETPVASVHGTTTVVKTSTVVTGIAMV